MRRLLIFKFIVFAIINTLLGQTGDHPHDHQYFKIANFQLESGETLPEASLLFVTRGKINSDSSNVIVLPTPYGSTGHHSYDFLIGEDKAIDPNKYFVIIPELFSAGGSSSPSNTSAPFDGVRFPEVSIRDNVRAGYMLLSEHLKIKHLRAVIGYSMGAQQAFQWAVSYPAYMDLIVPICGTAKTYEHGRIRIQSATDIIKADPNYNNGDFTSISPKIKYAWASHWIAWMFSQEYWRTGMNKPYSAEGFAQGFASAFSYEQIKDMLHLAKTWQGHNVGDTQGFNGDVAAALKSIKAEVLYMPGATDLYFPVEDAEYEKPFIQQVQFLPIPSVWGHVAGAGMNPEDAKFINEQIKFKLEN